VAWEHAPDMVAALVSITLLTYPRFYPLRPACFPRYFLHLCYDGVYAFRPRSCLWCGFDAVSSGLPPPFPSLSRSSLVCLCCHCGCSLFYSFGFLHSLLPPSRHYASARPHVNRHHSPALHPVFQQLVPTASVYFYTPLSLVVSRYAPLVVLCGSDGTRTRAQRQSYMLVAPFTSLSLPECLAVPPRVNHIIPFSTIL